MIYMLLLIISEIFIAAILSVFALMNNDWIYFDDRVFKLNKNSEKGVVTNKAYILFYKRQRFRSGNILKTMSLSS